MITTREEALELCKKFEIKLSEHDTVIVTGNNSIYLSDNIDTKDTSQKFYLKGATLSIESEKVVKVSTKKPVSLEVDEKSEDQKIEDEIIKEEEEKKKKDSKK